MSWIGREVLIHWYLREPDRQLDVESSEMREAIGLRYYLSHGGEGMAAEELGRRIDDCLVDYICINLEFLTTGDISIEEFESRMPMIEEGMEEDPELQAFAVTLQGRAGLRPASKTYLNLAKRQVLSEGKRPPSFEEGRRFALVQLGEFMGEDKGEVDWDSETLIGGQAVMWLNGRDTGALQRFIHDSEKSPVAWDTLSSIGQKLADRGERPSYELLKWYFMANHGHPERPDEGSAPRHRPRKLGYKLRDSEIRYTVDLLVQVGMSKTNARSAVAKAFNYSPARISGICLEPYWTVDDLVKDARKRTEPAYHALLYGPDSNSGPSTST